jgi:hypothetical protein
VARLSLLVAIEDEVLALAPLGRAEGGGPLVRRGGHAQPRRVALELVDARLLDKGPVGPLAGEVELGGGGGASRSIQPSSATSFPFMTRLRVERLPLIVRRRFLSLSSWRECFRTSCSSSTQTHSPCHAFTASSWTGAPFTDPKRRGETAGKWKNASVATP